MLHSPYLLSIQYVRKLHQQLMKIKKKLVLIVGNLGYVLKLLQSTTDSIKYKTELALSEQIIVAALLAHRGAARHQIC